MAQPFNKILVLSKIETRKTHVFFMFSNLKDNITLYVYIYLSLFIKQFCITLYNIIKYN